MGSSPSKTASSSSSFAFANGNSSSTGDQGIASSLLDTAGNLLCGSTTDIADHDDVNGGGNDSLFAKADAMCISSPRESKTKTLSSYQTAAVKEQAPPHQHDAAATADMNPTSALLARALVSEVTDNPNTMTPAAMAERERRLLKAQEAALKVGKTSSSSSSNSRQHSSIHNNNIASDINGGFAGRPVGTMGQPSLLGSLAHAFKGGDDADHGATTTTTTKHGSISRAVPPSALMENRAQRQHSASATTASSSPFGPPYHHGPSSSASNHNAFSMTAQPNKHSVTIGLSLSRRNASIGHPDTVTRQTAFDFNELQDRQYKYVSSTDASGWMAGGGERGTNSSGAAAFTTGAVVAGVSATSDMDAVGIASSPQPKQDHPVTSMLTPQGQTKLAAPDLVHIPILQIDAESPAAVNLIVKALAQGEIFIPHMSIMPEALSVNGISPPDLVVRFGCERNDDVPPEEWPNWCLEFMHNQLFEYFRDMGAIWSVRPFQITLARKVRWKTVKHMNRYFAHAERVIDAWREKGPQYLDPQLSYIEGGATPEEVARPHGIYLMRHGVPTNYFAPNFDPPYTTKMTRSLLINVLSKSWDKKRREWTSMPVPRLVTPTMLVASMCGCTDPNQGGFMASEVTAVNGNSTSTRTDSRVATHGGGHVTAGAALDETPRRTSGIPQVQEGRDEEEDDYAQVVDVSMSNKSGSSTKVSSVNLTPYDDEEGIPKPNPLAQLGTTLEADLSLEDSDDDNDLFEEQDLMGKDAPPSKLGSHSSLEHKTSGGSGGRYGQSPTPEGSNRLPIPRSPTPENIIGSSSRQYPKSPTPESNRIRSRSPSPPVSPFNDYDESLKQDLPTSSAPSEFGSTTTVQHMNSTSEKLMQREAERKKLREQKRTGHQALAPTLHATEGIDEVSSSSENVTPKSSTSSSKKKKKTKNKVKDAYEKERARQIAMIALAQEETKKMTRSLKAGTALSEKNENAPKFNMDTQPSPKRGQQGMERNDSGSVSLEYSLDSSMMGESSTLAGQFIGGDASVSTAASRRRAKRMIDEDASATSQATDVVPSDEDLFAVGWAKALDPKSGSFYYFTLDRSKIVWENPLSPEDSHTNASSSIPT